MLAIVRLMANNQRFLFTTSFGNEEDNFFKFNFRKRPGFVGSFDIKEQPNMPEFIIRFKQELIHNIMENKDFYYTLIEPANFRTINTGGKRTRKYKKNKKSKRYSRK